MKNPHAPFQPKTMSGVGQPTISACQTLREFIVPTALAESLRAHEPPASDVRERAVPANQVCIGRVVHVTAPVRRPQPPAIAQQSRPTPPPLPTQRAAANDPRSLSSAQQALAVGALGRVFEPVVLAADGGKPQPAEPTSSMFREQAVRAYEQGEKIASVLRLTAPSWWTFFAVLILAVSSALIAGVVCKVDVTGKGRGILRSPGGAQTLSAAITASVAEVHVESGQRVHAGDRIMTLDATALRAEQTQAREHLAFVQRRMTDLIQNRKLHERSLQLLATQSTLTQERLRSENESLRTLAQRRAAYQSLGERGFVARVGADDIHEQMRVVERERLGLSQELAHTQLQAVLLERERQEQLLRVQADLEQAQSRVAALETMLVQTSLRAPADGRVEGLSSRVGDQVRVGQAVATLVPLTAPSQVVAYVDDRDRAFLRPGSRARLDIDQLPATEFGMLTGRVRSIGAHFASIEERQATLGEANVSANPCYRVEVELLPTPRNQQLLSRLRAGALITARFSLRERRLITLVLAPLRALFE